MKVRTLVFSLLLIATALMVMSDMSQRASAQTLLVDNTPVIGGVPVPDDYEFEVLSEDHAVIGVRLATGDDFDIEVYEDTTFTTMIESSTTVGDEVDFVVLDKTTWANPPNRGARVTLGSTSYIIEMENDVDDYTIMDSWSGSMDIFPGNPVLDVGPPGSWDDVYAYFPSIHYDGLIYHMWYSGYDGSIVRIGYANSTDGITWTKYAGNPVLNPGPNLWDAFQVHYPMVLYNGTGFEMWYSGYDGTHYRVGYATSLDGISWTKYAANPVLNLGPPGSWEDFYVGQSSVLREGGTYHMWYSGLDSGGIGRTGYATSPDGITWTKHSGNPVLDIGPSGSWDDYRAYVPEVINDGSIYHMWYSGNDGSTYRIGYATSFDKVNWIKSPTNPVLDLGPPGSWEDVHVHSPTVLYDGTTYHMWYSGSDGPKFRIGYATSPDKDNWTKFAFAEVLDAYEITGITAGSYWTITLDVPPTADLGLFIFNTTGGRDDAVASSTKIGAGINELINFTAQTTGDYLLVITNEDGGTGTYNLSFIDYPPTIIDVTAVPNPQEVFYVVNVSANITDNYQLFGAWVEIYNSDGGLVGNLSMKFDPVNGRYYWNQTYDILGTYSFTIWANDTSDNWASASDTFVIQDTTPPIIADVTAVPNPQEVFYAVNISANITDNYQLFDAKIEIYDPDGGLVGNLSMKYGQVNGRYYWNQTYDLLGTYSSTIWANDTSDNWASTSDAFVIQDTTPPMITNIATVPDPQKVFGAVNISANVADNYQLYGVWVEIYDLDGNFIGNFSMSYDTDNRGYFWNQTYDIVGIYNFTILANDTSDNWASALGSFVIQPTLPPTISDVTADPVPQIVGEEVTISAIVTDEDTDFNNLTVRVNITKPDGTPLGNFTMTYNLTTGKYSYTSFFDIIGNYTFVIWANDTEGNLAKEDGTFVMEPKPEPREFNWKPIIALIFTIILLILGVLVAYYRPVRFTGILEKDRWYTFLGGVLPFVIAEVITGIVSFFTGLLSVPPILGLGMILDLVILIAGIISCLVIYKKGVSLESYEEITQPGPTETPKIPYEPSQSHNGIIKPPEDPGIPLPKPSEPPITPPPFQYE